MQTFLSEYLNQGIWTPKIYHTSPSLSKPNHLSTLAAALMQCFGHVGIIKTESIRKLSNQWTKTLYQNNLKYIAFFFTLFKSFRHNKLSVITPKTISYGSPRN